MDISYLFQNQFLWHRPSHKLQPSVLTETQSSPEHPASYFKVILKESVLLRLKRFPATTQCNPSEQIFIELWSCQILTIYTFDGNLLWKCYTFYFYKNWLGFLKKKRYHFAIIVSGKYDYILTFPHCIKMYPYRQSNLLVSYLYHHQKYKKSIYTNLIVFNY